MAAATPTTRERHLALREKDTSGYLAPYELKAGEEWRDKEDPAQTVS